MLSPSFLPLSDGSRLAYHQIAGYGPVVLFLHGFRSDMQGIKALTLAEHCRQKGQAFLCFDHFGHGESSGDFIDGTIGRWRQDAVTILDELVSETVILVGSSMGGWMALLLAQDRPQKMAGFVGVASAPDFTERLIVENLSVENKKDLESQGFFLRPSIYGDPYPITRNLLEEAKNHLVLDKPITLRAPVHLLHGMRDTDVPWQFSTELAEKVLSQDVQVSLLKTGDHRLSEPHELAVLCHAIDIMSEKLRHS